MVIIINYKNILGLVLVFGLVQYNLVYAQVTPLEWQSREPVKWSRDANRNRIDDLIENRDPGDRIDIVVDLRVTRSETELIQVFSQFGEEIMVGKYITFVSITNVLVADVLESIVSLPDVVMIEYAAGFSPGNNISVREVKISATSEYSPDTVEDAFPGLDGSGINICIMDCGVDDDIHESFTGKFVGGYNAFTDTVTNPDDDRNGHGTHVAGTALGTGGSSGTYRGAAPGAGLVDVKIFNPSTSCAAPTMWSTVTKGLEWIVSNYDIYNIRVVNMSFGQCDRYGRVYSNGLDAFSQLVNYGVDKGIVMVTIAHNDNVSGKLPSPGAASRAITVGASDDKNTVTRTDTAMAYFSNRGPREDDFDGDPWDELKPEITAPGVDIMSAEYNTVAGYTEQTGTSMSAPCVAGIAALILQANPIMNAGSVRNLLIRTAEDIDPSADMPGVDPIWNTDWGWGLVDAFAALSTLANADVRLQHGRLWSDCCCDSTDITFFSDPGAIVGGEYNEIHVDVINDGPDPVSHVTVHFSIHEFAPGIHGWYDVGTKVIDMASGDTEHLIQTWTPLEKSGAGNRDGCCRVEISYGLDEDFSNNCIQRNITIYEFAPPELDFIPTFFGHALLLFGVSLSFFINKLSMTIRKRIKG